MDDRHLGERSSVNYYLNCPYARPVETVYGPTQITLPAFSFDRPLSLALIDGPHAFPFPELEYYHIYPHLEKGAYLIIDDIDIASVRNFYSVVKEDEMFEVVDVVSGKTAILRRTEAPTFDPLGDGWSTQNYNRRRMPTRSRSVQGYLWRKLSQPFKRIAKPHMRRTS
jgi:hypothetical protein